MPRLWPGSARTQLLIAAGALAAFAIALVCFPPQRFAFYPACIFHQWTGLECPGCGFTRALSSLITGRARDAASENAMVFVLVPAAALFAVWQSYFVLRWNSWRNIRCPQRWVSVFCAAMVIFGVLRNTLHR